MSCRVKGCIMLLEETMTTYINRIKTFSKDYVSGFFDTYTERERERERERDIHTLNLKNVNLCIICLYQRLTNLIK